MEDGDEGSRIHIVSANSGLVCLDRVQRDQGRIANEPVYECDSVEARSLRLGARLLSPDSPAEQKAGDNTENQDSGPKVRSGAPAA